MKIIRHLSFLFAISTLIAFVSSAQAAPVPEEFGSAKITPLSPTQVVEITPPYGYATKPIRVRLSKSEQDMIRLLQNIAKNWNSDFPPPQENLQWRIEASAERSRTLALSIDVLDATQAFYSVPAYIDARPIVVIVARSQAFIKQQVASLGCRPSLERNGGQYQMGATNGYVPNDEPAWFREGLAEIISGLSRVRASNGRMSYLDFHVIRIRRFFDWTKNCVAPLRTYRRTGDAGVGCEYLRGAAAFEMLLARHGGIPKVIELSTSIDSTNDFYASFRQVYGFSVTAFEKKADIYAQHSRTVTVLGP